MCQDLPRHVSKRLKELLCYTISIVKFGKENNSVTNAGGVMIRDLCMSFDDALYLYQGS